MYNLLWQDKIKLGFQNDMHGKKWYFKKMYTTDKKVEINEHYTPQKKKKKSYTIYIYFFCIKWLTIFLFVNNIYKQNPVEWLCLTLNIVQNVVNRGYKQDYENWNT